MLVWNKEKELGIGTPKETRTLRSDKFMNNKRHNNRELEK